MPTSLLETWRALPVQAGQRRGEVVDVLARQAAATAETKGESGVTYNAILTRLRKQLTKEQSRLAALRNHDAKQRTIGCIRGLQRAIREIERSKRKSQEGART